MTEHTRTCPHCNAHMTYRLGVFECPACGREESARENLSTGLGLVEKPLLASRAPSVAYQSHHERTGNGSAKGFKEATWDLGKEKIYLLIAYLGFSLLSMLMGLAAIRSLGGTSGGSIAEMIVGELIDVAMLAVILYIPLKCLKQAVGCYLTLMLIIGIISLFLSMIFIPLAGLVLGGGSAITAAYGAVGIVISVIDLGLKAWLASVLFRDLY